MGFPNTNLVLLKYENESTNGSLPHIDHSKLQEHLGRWFISILAPHKRDRELLDETRLTTNTYEKVMHELRESWKIWKPSPTPTQGESEYHGANWDGRKMHNTPFKDIATHDRKLAMLGCLPDTYVKFLQTMGHTTAMAHTTRKHTAHTMRAHLKTMLKTYWKLTTHHFPPKRKIQTTNTTQPTEEPPTAVVVQDSEEHGIVPQGGVPSPPCPG